VEEFRKSVNIRWS